MTIEDIKNEVTRWRLSKYKLVNLCITIITIILYEFVGRPYYRKYIYSNNIFDFHIADTLGNSLGTIAAIFFFLFAFSRDSTHGQFLIKTVTISVILYELAQPLFGKPIDMWDALATFLAGILSYAVYRLLFMTDKNVKA